MPNLLPISGPPADMQEGLANYVALAYNSLERGDVENAKSLLLSLYGDVVDECYKVAPNKPEDNSPVPEYDPYRDGNYSEWLVSNNID